MKWGMLGSEFGRNITHGHVLLQGRRLWSRPWCCSQRVWIVEAKERNRGVLGHHRAEEKYGRVNRGGCRMKGGDACYILGGLFALYHAARLIFFVMFLPKSWSTMSL